MKTAISIGVMTVLSGVGAAAWAQAPATQPAQTQQTVPQTQQNVPRSEQSGQTVPQSSQSSQTSPNAAPVHESSATYAASFAAEAEKETERQHKELHAMDSDKDGLVSRQEYMSYHENMYDGLKKDSAGMISLANLAGSTTTGLPSDSASRSRVNR